jgi:rhodanese-related sulfurtransferase
MRRMAQQLEIDAAQAQELLAGATPPVLLDVREDYERQVGRIPGSVHIPLGDLAGRSSELDGADQIIVYCRAGARSLMAAQALDAAGYQAYSLRGGLLEWAAAGRALDPPDGTVADHGTTS